MPVGIPWAAERLLHPQWVVLTQGKCSETFSLHLCKDDCWPTDLSFPFLLCWCLCPIWGLDLDKEKWLLANSSYPLGRWFPHNFPMSIQLESLSNASRFSLLEFLRQVNLFLWTPHNSCVQTWAIRSWSPGPLLLLSLPLGCRSLSCPVRPFSISLALCLSELWPEMLAGEAQSGPKAGTSSVCHLSSPRASLPCWPLSSERCVFSGSEKVAF